MASQLIRNFVTKQTKLLSSASNEVLLIEKCSQSIIDFDDDDYENTIYESMKQILERDPYLIHSTINYNDDNNTLLHFICSNPSLASSEKIVQLLVQVSSMLNDYEDEHTTTTSTATTATAASTATTSAAIDRDNNHNTIPALLLETSERSSSTNSTWATTALTKTTTTTTTSFTKSPLSRLTSIFATKGLSLSSPKTIKEEKPEQLLSSLSCSDTITTPSSTTTTTTYVSVISSLNNDTATMNNPTSKKNSSFRINPSNAYILRHKNKYGETALHKCCLNASYSSIYMIEYLIESYPASVCMKDNILNNTPLHYVCAACTYQPITLDIIMYMIDKWPEAIQCRNKNGDLPIHLAVQMNMNHTNNNNTEKKNKSSSSASSLSTSALVLLREEMQLQIIQYMLEYWPFAIHVPNHDGYTPIQVAAISMASIGQVENPIYYYLMDFIDKYPNDDYLSSTTTSTGTNTNNNNTNTNTNFVVSSEQQQQNNDYWDDSSFIPLDNDEFYVTI